MPEWLDRVLKRYTFRGVNDQWWLCSPYLTLAVAGPQFWNMCYMSLRYTAMVPLISFNMWKWWVALWLPLSRQIKLMAVSKKVEDIKGFTISSTVVCVCKFKWDAIFAKLYCWSCLWYDQASWKPSTLPSDHPNTPGLRGLPPSSKPWRLNGGNPRWPCRHVWPACAYYLVHHQHCSILGWPFQIRLYQVINYVNSSGKYRTM